LNEDQTKKGKFAGRGINRAKPITVFEFCRMSSSSRIFRYRPKVARIIAELLFLIIMHSLMEVLEKSSSWLKATTAGGFDGCSSAVEGHCVACIAKHEDISGRP